MKRLLLLLALPVLLTGCASEGYYGDGGYYGSPGYSPGYYPGYYGGSGIVDVGFYGGGYGYRRNGYYGGGYNHAAYASNRAYRGGNHFATSGTSHFSGHASGGSRTAAVSSGGGHTGGGGSHSGGGHR